MAIQTYDLIYELNTTTDTNSISVGGFPTSDGAGNPYRELYIRGITKSEDGFQNMALHFNNFTNLSRRRFRHESASYSNETSGSSAQDQLRLIWAQNSSPGYWSQFTVRIGQFQNTNMYKPYQFENYRNTTAQGLQFGAGVVRTTDPIHTITFYQEQLSRDLLAGTQIRVWGVI